MSKLFIPELGTLLTLEKDWTFTLHKESRNDSLWAAFKCGDLQYVKAYEDEKVRLWAEFNSAVFRRSKIGGHQNPLYQNYQNEVLLAHRAAIKHEAIGVSVDVMIPAGSVLNVDRIYIRKNASDFSSVSFYIESSPNADIAPILNKKGTSKKKRFWAKLTDVNNLEYV